MPASAAFWRVSVEGGAVDGGDHEDLGALGDHVLDLGDLGRDVVLGVLEVGLVAERRQRLDEVVAVRDPAGGRLGRHRDADEATGAGRADSAGAPRPSPPGPRWRPARWLRCRRTQRRQGHRPQGPLSGTSSSVCCAPPVTGREPRIQRPGSPVSVMPARRAGSAAGPPGLQVDRGWTHAVIVPVNDNAPHAMRLTHAASSRSVKPQSGTDEARTSAGRHSSQALREVPVEVVPAQPGRGTRRASVVLVDHEELHARTSRRSLAGARVVTLKPRLV